MRRTLIALAAALALGVAACGESEPPVGTITALQHIPAHNANVEVEDYMLMCGGNPLSCWEVFVGTHLETQAFPAQWTASLVSCRPPREDPRGKVTCHEYLIDVTPEQYASWSVGDFYPAVLNYKGLRGSAG